MSRLVPLLILTGLIALFLAFGLAPGRDPSAIPSPFIGKTLPEITLETLAGGTLHSTNLAKDGPVLVNVFASWCAPCATELPVLQRFTDTAKIPLIGIAYKDDPDDLKQWLDRHGNPYQNIGLDPKGQAAIELGVYGVPETMVVSPEGRLLFRHAGPVTSQIIESEIVPLLNTQPGASR